MYKYILILHGWSSDLVCPRRFHQHRGASFILMLIKDSCLERRALFSLLWSYFYHPQAELARMISRLSLSDLPTESRGLSPKRWNLAVVLRGSRPRCTVYIEWDVKQRFLEAWVTAAVWLVFPQPPYGRNVGANTFLSNCLVFVRRELGEGVASLLVFGIYPLHKLTWIASINMVFIQATASVFADSSCIIRNMHQLLMLQYFFFFMCIHVSKETSGNVCAHLSVTGALEGVVLYRSLLWKNGGNSHSLVSLSAGLLNSLYNISVSLTFIGYSKTFA